jgi:hypothetical protein
MQFVQVSLSTVESDGEMQPMGPVTADPELSVALEDNVTRRCGQMELIHARATLHSQSQPIPAPESGEGAHTPVVGGLPMEETAESDEAALAIRAQESAATDKMRSFCAKILKTLAPPLLKEIELASKVHSDTEIFTPKWVTRASLLHPSSATVAKKASSAETVLLKALGITPNNLSVDEMALQEFRNLFDSPIRERQL